MDCDYFKYRCSPSENMASCTESGDATPNRLVIAQLSKTRMCIKFTKGTCKDSECCFAHSEEELRVQPNLAKTAMCRAYQRGKCLDAECKYAHGEDELRVNPNVYKTQLCNFFQRGHCKKGNSCRHAHGHKELRSLQEQIPPLPGRKESLATPKRGAKLTQTPESPGPRRTALGDLSNQNNSASEQVFQTPPKTSMMGAAQERRMGYSGIPKIPTTWEPMKVPFPELSPATPPQPCTPLGAPGLLLPQSPELPVSWGSPGSPSVPLIDTFAKAAAAAAMSAHQHTMAANAASSAAMNWALMHANLMPGNSQTSLEDTPESMPTACKQASDNRRWVV